ncbi:MAG: EpsI family protein [Desulfuromonadales bacterium]|nr:EpsI family protein [Desulfuromonadales bacterium]
MGKRLCLVAAIIALFGGYLKAYPFDHSDTFLEKPLSSLPLRINGWEGKDFSLEGWVLDMLKLTDYVQREYRRGQDKVFVYLGYYASQRKGAEIHSPTLCLPGSGWVNVSERVRTMEMKNGEKIKLVESIYAKDSAKEVFIYWYQMKGNCTTNKYTLKLNKIINSVKYRRTDASFLRFSSPVTVDEQSSINTIESFLQDFLPLVKEYLPE